MLKVQDSWTTAAYTIRKLALENRLTKEPDGAEQTFGGTFLQLTKSWRTRLPPTKASNSGATVVKRPGLRCPHSVRTGLPEGQNTQA